MRALPKAPPPGVDAVPSNVEVETLYKLHAATVAGWVHNLAGPLLRVQGEDLLHEIFLVVQRQLPAFRGEAKVTTWLYRITQNVVSTARRKERGRRWIGHLRRKEIGRAVSGVDPSRPGEELERRQQAHLLYRALDTLPDKYRSLLILFEIEALSGEEISTLTGVGRETVRVRLHRARKLFLNALEQLGVTRDD